MLKIKITGLKEFEKDLKTILSTPMVGMNTNHLINKMKESYRREGIGIISGRLWRSHHARVVKNKLLYGNTAPYSTFVNAKKPWLTSKQFEDEILRQVANNIVNRFYS